LHGDAPTHVVAERGWPGVRQTRLTNRELTSRRRSSLPGERHRSLDPDTCPPIISTSGKLTARACTPHHQLAWAQAPIGRPRRHQFSSGVRRSGRHVSLKAHPVRATELHQMVDVGPGWAAPRNPVARWPDTVQGNSVGVALGILAAECRDRRRSVRVAHSARMNRVVPRRAMSVLAETGPAQHDSFYQVRVGHLRLKGALDPIAHADRPVVRSLVHLVLQVRDERCPTPRSHHPAMITSSLPAKVAVRKPPCSTTGPVTNVRCPAAVRGAPFHPPNFGRHYAFSTSSVPPVDVVRAARSTAR